jgi:DNA-binding PadR family transcriptional regulator
MLCPVLHRLERQGLVASKLEAERKRWQMVDGTLNRIWLRACTV